MFKRLISHLGAYRAWSAESENRPQRVQFLPDLQPNSPAIGQKDGEKWAAEVDLQPATSKSDRLLVGVVAICATAVMVTGCGTATPSSEAGATGVTVYGTADVGASRTRR